MLRKSLFWIALLSLVALAVFTLACGGSSSSTTKACTGTYNVIGDWNLTLNGTALVGGVIDSTGLALFFDSAGDVVAFPSLTGACSFTGTATSYSIAGNSTATVTGNVTSDASISGTASNSTGSASFSAVPVTPLTGSVAAVSGSMLASITDDPFADIWEITVTPTGTGAGMTFTGPNTSDTCTISGTFTQEGTTSANLNVFSTSVSFTGTGCAYSTITGLGFEGSSDYLNFSIASGTYLYAITSNAPVVMEIYPTGLAARQSQRHQQRHGLSFRF